MAQFIVTAIDAPRRLELRDDTAVRRVLSEAETVRPRAHRSVTIVRDSGIVQKRYPGLIDREVRKARQMFAISRRHEFLAPELVGADQETGVVTFKLLPPMVALRDLYIEHMEGRDAAARCVSAVHMAGEALAAIHRELDPDGCTPWVAPLAFTEQAHRQLGASWWNRLQHTPQAALHGDYGFGNVHVTCGAQPRLAVLDASPNHYITFDPLTVGSIYLDLASLRACFLGLVPWRRFVRLRSRRWESLDKALIGSYESASGIRLDTALLDGVTSAVLTSYLVARTGSRLLTATIRSVIERRGALGGR